ncbi:MAG: TolC family protein [Planctomycetota bacterium]
MASGPVAVDLPTVLRLSRDRSLDARIVRERVREAYARQISARERFLPTLFLGARFATHGGITQETAGAFLDITKQSSSAGGVVALQWEIGEAVYASLAARQRTEASRAASEAGGAGAALKAGHAYLDLVGAQASLSVAEEAVTLAESVLKETEGKVAAGGGFRGDLLRARAQLGHERLVLDTAREEVRRSSLRLAELLDLPPEVELRATDPAPVRLSLVQPAPEEELVAAALRDRPEIREAAYLQAAAARESDAARYGPWVPTVAGEASLGGFGQTFGDLGQSDDYRIGLLWKIGPGGLFDAGRKRGAKSRLAIAELEVARIRAQVAREVLEANAAVLFRASSIDVAAAGVKDAAEALDLYRERLKGGIGLPLEAVLAEEGLARARRDWIQMTVEYDQAQLRLLHALGGGRLADDASGERDAARD